MRIGATGSEATVPSAQVGPSGFNGSDVTVSSSVATTVFTGFDSTTIWNINSSTMTGGALPTLKTNTQSPAPTLPAGDNSSSGAPDGSAGNPFLVATEADLRKVGTDTGGWSLSVHYKQTENITLSGSFTRIGNSANKFTGSYDGDGKTITNLTMSMTDALLGVFGNIGATGTVKNMTVTGTITQNGNESTGGIAGVNEGTIDNCSFSGTVTGTNSDEVGGIAGKNTGTIINSRNFATISGRTAIGGITGLNNGKIDNSFNRNGTVSGNDEVGGIAGANSGSGSYIKNSYSTVNITGAMFPGGIAGANQGGALIEYCYSTGNVTGTSGAFGISGRNTAGSTVRNCVALSPKLTTSNSASVGRIASDSGTLSNNKARQDMKTGISGSEATVTSDQTGVNHFNGADVALNTAQTSVFSGWDTAIWNINTGNLSNGALPTLKPNPQSSTTLPTS
jgi:hypothetical protein